ncbi:MAG: hypothetical protein HYS55_03720 [Candidatus Omnitrophica bacterium]|nr:hypothetical protein [Candidatus Omnitrophota bacterium]
MRKWFALSFLCILCMFSLNSKAHAEVLPESFKNELLKLQEMVKGLQSTVQDLNTAVASQNEVIEKQTVRIEALEQGEVSSQEAAQPKDAPPLQGRVNSLNPEIGVVGTVQANLTESTEDGEGRDTIALKEIELNFAQYVDPYSRLDAVISFNDALEAQNTEVEEAYYTHWGLPYGFVGQIGKFRSKIGKQNLLHLDQLPTVDYPLVIQNFFGEEGLSSSGARLQNMVPNPWDIPLELTGEILRGNNGTIFSGVSRRPVFNTHAKSFFELSDSVDFELGGTVMFGDENIPIDDETGTGTLVRPAKGQDRYGVQVFGGDATFVWHLPEDKTVKFQNEVYFADRSNFRSPNANPWGFYSLLDYRFSKRFSAGVRFDYLEPLGVSEPFGHGQTTAISPYITFWQSEFANFRLQYQHIEQADPSLESDDQVFLQANFLIGSHRHPVQ